MFLVSVLLEGATTCLPSFALVDSALEDLGRCSCKRALFIVTSRLMVARAGIVVWVCVARSRYHDELRLTADGRFRRQGQGGVAATTAAGSKASAAPPALVADLAC